MGLIVNEFIKVIKRPFIWIFLCLGLISVVVSASFLSDSRSTVQPEENYDSYKGFISNIEERMKSPGSEEELKLLENQRELYTLLYDNEISEESWRFVFLKEIYEAKLYVADESVFDPFIEIVVNNDWLAYYSAQIDTLEASDDAETEETKITIEMYKTLLEKKAEPDKDNKLYSLITEYFDLKRVSLKGEDTEGQKENLAILKHRIETENYREERNSARCFLNFTLNIKYLFVYIIALGLTVFSTEYSECAFNQYMSCPFKRWKKLLAKYAVIFVILLCIVLLFMAFAFIAVFIFYDKSDLAYKYIYYSGHSVKELNFTVHIIHEYLKTGLNVLSYTSLGIMLTILLRKPAVPVAVSTALYLSLDRVLNYFRDNYVLPINIDFGTYGIFISISILVTSFIVSLNVFGKDY